VAISWGVLHRIITVRTDAVNKVEWRALAEARVLDAEALLAASRWPAAYYLIGYAVECGLKACV